MKRTVNNISQHKIFGILVLLVTLNGIHGQSAHTDITDPELNKRFRKISETIVCACGCQSPLAYCNHRPCVAWGMRSVIEGLLLDGQSDDFIIKGFIYGFGAFYDSHKAFEMVRTQPEYRNLESRLRNGFGEQFLSKPDDTALPLMILMAALIIAGISVIFIKKRMKKLQQSTASVKPTESNAVKSAEEQKKEDLYKKLYE